MTVSSPEIPNADALLHADCNDQEVMCEMSLYSAHGAQNSSDSPFFMVSLNVEGDQFSTVLIMQTLAVTDESPLMQNKLGLPLSQSGTLLTEGEKQSLIFSLIILSFFFLFFAVTQAMTFVSLPLFYAPQ